YAKQCQKCHGSRGRGDGPLGKAIRNIQDLTDPSMRNKSDQELFDRITGAPPPMPSFKRLKEEDRWNLVNYIRTFAPKPDES
ncbi:MAG: c-type cytochrome, partial [Waddliaceae bacterium]